MVNSAFTPQDDVTSLRAAERRLVSSYAPAASRNGFAALLALDDALGDILRTTREPLVGQMRLTWWHDALARLDEASPPAQPVLTALAADVVPHVRGAVLAAMVEGWEELLEPGDLDDAALMRFAQARGGALFAAAGRVVAAGARDPLADAGAGWALADLAAHSGDAKLSSRAAALAEPLLRRACARRWSRAGRPLGAMTHLARLAGQGPLRRTARVLLHRLTGI